MPLTKDEVKERLGRGGATAIALAANRSKSHVSRVLDEQRSDRRVAVAVARRLRVKLSDLPVRYCREVS
jgi:predicted nucleic acid-binding protein